MRGGNKVIKTVESDEFSCAMCSGLFKKGQTDEEAWTEYDSNFPTSHEEAELVCDDCYKELGLTTRVEEYQLDRMPRTKEMKCPICNDDTDPNSLIIHLDSKHSEEELEEYIRKALEWYVTGPKKSE